MDYKNWKKHTKTGGFRRKIQKKYKEMIDKSNVLLLPEKDKNISEGSVGSACIRDVDIEDSDSFLFDRRPTGKRTTAFIHLKKNNYFSLDIYCLDLKQ